MEGSTPLLVGIVMGGYALTQAIFQVPFGILSDKFGRKPLILIGLIIFLIGSIISAISDDIYMLILGRFLQGAGAIGTVISATISDFVREEERAKAMSFVGISIALSFALAMMIGAILGGIYTMTLLFELTVVFTLIAIVSLFFVKNPPKIEVLLNDTENKIFKNKNLLYLMTSSFLQKGAMSITFMLIPLILTSDFHWDKSELWKVYIPAMIFGFLVMPLSAIIGEKKNKPKLIFIISTGLFVLTAILLNFIENENLFLLTVILFFVAFNLIEPLIQSMVSKFSQVAEKGKALGFTNSFAYFGTFFGGTFVGLILETHNIELLSYILLVLNSLWFLWTLTIKNPVPKKNIYLDLSQSKNSDILEILNLKTKQVLNSDFYIFEYYINKTENILIIRYNSEQTSEKEIISKLKNYEV
jgi:predicted MFS family arabinose efflux permease